MADLNLDVPSADAVAVVLRAAAEAFAQSAEDCNAAWQPAVQNHGRVWQRIARELDRAALRCEQICNQEGVSAHA